MAASSTLCKLCRKIPFFARDPPVDGTEWVLGSLHAIRNRLGCPLCCIITAGLDQRLRSSIILETDEITLMWNQDRGNFSVKRWSPVDKDEYELCFVSGFTPSAWQLERPQNFMAISALQRYIDYTRIRVLLQACIDDHGDSCNPERSSIQPSPLPMSLKTFRLIDIHDRCIVERQSFCRYLALSYVWGGVTSARLTTNNKATLLIPGALREYWPYLPQTIQDAITLTEKLGERYIWVDSICLLQNDPLDLQLGINVMDVIYERAIMTIVAANGENAHSGLPGVFGTHRDPYPRAGQNKARTFQEQLVSSRTLTFIDGRWVFRCRTNAWSENLLSSIDKRLSGYQDLSIGHAGPQLLLQELLSDYTSRLLTNQNDALNAIRGVLRRLSPLLGNSLIEGLPATAFDFFIPFTSGDSSFRRRKGFPSYSWTRWIGEIFYEYPSPGANWNLDKWLAKGTWII